MSILINRDRIDFSMGEEIYKKCVVIEEVSDYDKSKGIQPKSVVMMSKDETGNYFLIPYKIARDFGFQQENPYWKQIIFPVKSLDGSFKFMPEFTGTFRDYQTEIIPEIIECLQKNNSVIIGLPPGWGKTIIAAYLIWMIGLLPIVIIKQSKVYTGWQKTFQKVLPNARIWCVGDKISNSSIKTPTSTNDFDVILCMNERLNKIPQDIKKQVGVLIIDETHTIATQTQKMTFLGFQPKYIIFETATLKASSFWKMATTVSGEEGVFRISKIPYNFYVIRTGITGEEERDRTGRLIPSSVTKSLISNRMRKNIIQCIIYNHAKYRKFICLQTLVEGIDENISAFNNLGITCDTLWGPKNTYNQSMVLFGTYGKISTGFDEENACDNYWTIPTKSDTGLFVNSVLSPWLLIQSMGRCMRTLDEIPSFIFLLDENSNVKNHLNKNKWLIELTNGVIINVDYKNPFIPMNSMGTVKFSILSSPGNYYKILRSEEFCDFHKYGIYLGNEEERNAGFIPLQIYESINYYKTLICPNTPCFLLTLQNVNLYINNGSIIVNQGIVYCKHSLFFSHVISVNTF